MKTLEEKWYELQEENKKLRELVYALHGDQELRDKQQDLANEIVTEFEDKS